jgi:hypothetical protein
MRKGLLRSIHVYVSHEYALWFPEKANCFFRLASAAFCGHIVARPGGEPG